MSEENQRQSLLIAQSGPLNGERWGIHKEVIIGRDPNACTIVIPDRQISRVHARISVKGGEVILEDMGSKNGLFIDNQQITEPVKLQDGVIFSVALVQQFVFLSSDATLPLAPIISQRKDWKGKIFIDFRSRRVWVGEKEIDPPLSVPQFRLLQILYNQTGQVVNRDDLETEVWGDEGAVGISEQALDALIRRLRERIRALDPGHQYIVTVRGHGVRLDNPNS